MEVVKRLLAMTAAAALLVVGLVSVAGAEPAADAPTSGKLSAASVLDKVKTESGLKLDSVKTDAVKPVKSLVFGGTLDEGEVPVASDESEGFEDEWCLEEEWVPSEDEVAEINAETDALVAHLEGVGFAVTVVEDELGFRYVDFDENEEDEALWAAVDEFYRAQWADEVAGWSEGEKAEWNAHIEEFVAELAAEGITVETEEIAPGVIDIVWTEELEEAFWELEEGESHDEFDEEWTPSEDEIAEINAETDALVAQLAYPEVRALHHGEVRVLAGGNAAWTAAGLATGGAPGAAGDGKIEFSYRHAAGTRVYAGASEIMRSVIAQLALGMPRSRS